MGVAGDGGSVEKVKPANGIDRMMPDTPTGAIAGRTLRYLKRDPRMTSLLLNTFLVPLLASAPMLIHGWGEVHGPQTALIFTAIPFAAMFVATPMYAGSPCRSAWRWPSSPPGGVVSGSCCRL